MFPDSTEKAIPNTCFPAWQQKREVNAHSCESPPFLAKWPENRQSQEVAIFRPTPEMDFQQTLPPIENPEQALALAREAFDAAGFSTNLESPSVLDLKGPDLRHHRRNALGGFSRIRFQSSAGALQVSGEFGNVRRWHASLIYLIGGLQILFLGYYAWLLEGPQFLAAAVISSVAVLPWLLFLPTLAKRYRNRTRQALWDLLVQMKKVAGRKP